MRHPLDDYALALGIQGMLFALAVLAILWLAVAIATAVIAVRKGRTAGWGLAALLLSPLMTVILAALPDLRPLPRTWQKTCPECAEYVPETAAVCRACGHSFRQQRPPL